MINPFEGGSYKSQFSLIIYKRLISRLWFSNADVMADFLSCDSPTKLPFSIISVPLKSGQININQTIPEKGKN